MSWATIRAARAGCVIVLAMLAQSAPLLAQETRSLPAADRVPLHSIVDVSTLPPPPAVGDSGGARVKVKPRHLRSPKEPSEAFATPATVEDAAPPVAPSRLAVVSSFEGLGDLADNAITGFAAVPSDANPGVEWGIHFVFLHPLCAQLLALSSSGADRGPSRSPCSSSAFCCRST